MDLRSKALWGLVGVILIIVIVHTFLTVTIVLGHFNTIESTHVRDEIILISKNIDNELAGINTNARDWAAWDDTYAYTIGENSDFVTSNLVNTTYSTLHANFVIITDSQGNIRYGQGYNFSRNAITPLREDLAAEITDNRSIFRTTGPETQISGFLDLPQGAVMLASYPVLHSDYSGPPAGRVIIGRNIDNNEIGRIAPRSTQDITIRPMQDPGLSDADRSLLYQSGPTAILVYRLNTTTIEGINIIRDINGRDTLVLSIIQPRDIYQEGLYTILLFILIHSGLVLLIGIITIITFDSLVLARMSSISSDIIGITQRKDRSARLKTSGNDELTRMVETINTMLDEIEESHSSLQRSEEGLRKTVKKLNLLSGITRHDIKNQLLALMGFLEISIKTLGDPVRTAEFIEKEKKIARIIFNQISFTKDYEDIGVKAQTWQNLSVLVSRITSVLPMRDIHVMAIDPALEINADPLLEKVFYNLIDNSLRYGGEKLTEIRIYARKAGEDLIILVEDNGVGIAVDDKPHLFERGFGKNSGLGLFLSREILEITGITIRETSEPGNGARFEIVVPKGVYRFANQQ